MSIIWSEYIKLIRNCTYLPTTFLLKHKHIYIYTGADPGFQVRGGALKKIAPSRERRENFWGISCEKSRFYAKKSYFSNFRGGGGGGRRIVGVFRVKNHDFTPKNHIFPILGGGGAREIFGVFHVKKHDFTPKKSYFYQF